MVITGLEVIAIGSLVASATSALNSTDARKKAKKERQAKARAKAYGKHDELEDDTDLGPGLSDWKADSRANARGSRENLGESRTQNRLTSKWRSKHMPDPGSSSTHVYNESRSTFGPLSRVDTEGWSRESYGDERGRISSRREYADSRTSLGAYQLKSRYRERSQSRSRSRSRSRREKKSENRGLDLKTTVQTGIGIALAGAAFYAVSQYTSSRRNQQIERRKQFDGDEYGDDRERELFYDCE